MTVQIVHALSKQQAAELRRLIGAFVRESLSDSWKSGGDPDDVPVIEAELAASKARLERFIIHLMKSGE